MPKPGARTAFGIVDFIPTVAVAVVGLALSIAAFLAVRNYYHTLDEQQFRRDVTYYSTTFAAEIRRQVNSLEAIHAFVSSSHNITRWDFSSFAHQILPGNPGFKAVLWLPRVSQFQRKTFEQELQRDGLYGLVVREPTVAGELVRAPQRDYYLPVAYIEPSDNNVGLIGVDFSQNEIYAPIFKRAARIGQVTATEPQKHALVDGTYGPVVIVVQPLNKPIRSPNNTPNTPEGYVLGFLQLDSLLAASFGNRATVEAGIAYGVSTPAVLSSSWGKTFDLRHWFGNAEFHDVKKFAVAGKSYYLVMRSRPHDSALARLYAPFGAASLVLALVALLLQSMLGMTLRTRHVERAVVFRTAELSEANAVLSAEIEYRRQAEAALLVAKDKAQSANRAKSVFLSTMSHELRTPLNAVIGFSSLLLENRQSFNENSSDYLNEIHNSGIRLLDLINDILEISLIDSTSERLNESVQISEIIEAVVEKIQPAAEKNKIVLHSEISPSLPCLHGDGRRLQRALYHLASNAVKFGIPDGWIIIAAQSDGDRLVIEVRDNGVGLPPEEGSRLAELFSQGDGSLARRHEGVGLGLTFVSRVAESHGATLQIWSQPGEGTSIRMIFPAPRLVRIPEVA